MDPASFYSSRHKDYYVRPIPDDSDDSQLSSSSDEECDSDTNALYLPDPQSSGKIFSKIYSIENNERGVELLEKVSRFR